MSKLFKRFSEDKGTDSPNDNCANDISFALLKKLNKNYIETPFNSADPFSSIKTKIEEEDSTQAKITLLRLDNNLSLYISCPHTDSESESTTSEDDNGHSAFPSMSSLRRRMKKERRNLPRVLSVEANNSKRLSEESDEELFYEDDELWRSNKEEQMKSPKYDFNGDNKLSILNILRAKGNSCGLNLIKAE